MKKEKFKLDSFIGGWYINPKVCDNLIKYFETINIGNHLEKLDLIIEYKNILKTVQIYC